MLGCEQKATFSLSLPQHEKLEPDPQPFLPKQAGFANFTYHGLPAMFESIKFCFLNQRDYCDFCWTRSAVIIPPGLEPKQQICEPCIDRIVQRQMEGADLAELRPPWQPDGRVRRASQLYLAKIPAFVVASIAAFEVCQWVP